MITKVEVSQKNDVGVKLICAEYLNCNYKIIMRFYALAPDRRGSIIN